MIPSGTERTVVANERDHDAPNLNQARSIPAIPIIGTTMKTAQVPAAPLALT
jgi:hypothetical protein